MSVDPGADNFGNRFAHFLGITGQASPVEDWLEESALPPVIGMWTGEETVAEGFSDPVEQRAALVEGGVVEEKLSSEIRAADHEHFQRAEADLDEVTAKPQRVHETQMIAQ
jgi:hypothetical protein